MKVAFIFPAFVSEFIGTETQILNQLSDKFQQNLIKASKISGIDFTQGHLDSTDFGKDELSIQIASYIFSCSLSDELISRNLKPDILAGYSMGLYAALYTGKVISYEDGIHLIMQAFNISKSTVQNIDSGMGSIIGLKVQEIEEIIIKNQLKAEIANTNSVHSHLVTGRMDAIKSLLDFAKITGALHVSLLNVKTPYHASLLKDTRKPFGKFIMENTTIRKSNYPIISSIDQRIIQTPNEIQNELTDNLSERINWAASFNTMLETGITKFIECGAGKSLQKISRFQAGDFNMYPMNKLERLIG